MELLEGAPAVLGVYRALLDHTPYPSPQIHNPQRRPSQDPPYTFLIKWDLQGRDCLQAIMVHMQYEKMPPLCVLSAWQGNEIYAPITFLQEGRKIDIEFYGTQDMAHGFPGYDPYAFADSTKRLANPAIKKIALTGFSLEEMLLFLEAVDLGHVLDTYLFGK